MPLFDLEFWYYSKHVKYGKKEYKFNIWNSSNKGLFTAIHQVDGNLLDGVPSHFLKFWLGETLVISGSYNQYSTPGYVI